MMGTDYKAFLAFLNTQGYTGQVNEAFYAFLKSQGYSGQLNEMAYEFLTALGYTQHTLPEKWKAWLNDGLAVATEGYTITITSGTVGSTLTNFPVMIDLAEMPISFWDDVRDDGGNIRAYSGATQLPVDVVCVLPNAQSGTIWVKVPSIASAADTTFEIRLAAATELALDHDDTYGRHAVWADYEMVMLGGWDLANRAGGTYVMSGDPETFERVTTAVWTFTEDPHQGIAWDEASGDIITFDTNALRRYNSAGVLQVSNTDPSGDVETAEGSATLGHVCDGCIVGNYLVVPINNYPTEDLAFIATFDKTTLALVDTLDISATNADISSICYNPDTQRLVSVNWGGIASLKTYTINTSTGAIAADSTITVTQSEGSLTWAQGIEYYAGAYWLVDDERDEVLRCELDGTLNRSAGLINVNPNGTSITGNIEGITRYLDGLAMLVDPDAASSYVSYYRPRNIAGGGGGLHFEVGVAVGYPVGSATTWTMMITHSTIQNTQQGVMSYRDLSSGATDDRATISIRRSAATSNNMRREAWDNTNSWISETSPTTITTGQTHRHGVVYDNTTRYLYANGALKNSGSITARDAEFDYITIGQSDEGDVEPFDGNVGFAYLRHSALSADWLAAEWAMVNSPGTFCVIGEYN